MESNETGSKIKGIVIGYVRVSSVDQHVDRQVEALNAFKPDRLFTDKISGKDTNRPALEEMMRFARQGDTIIISSLDRLARSLTDLCSLVKDLTDRGVAVKFIKESLVFGDGGNGDSATGQLTLHILGAIAQFERTLIRGRQAEGIQIAKREGKYLGRQRVLTAEQVETARQRIAAGVSKAKVARDLGVARQSLYNYLTS